MRLKKSFIAGAVVILAGFLLPACVSQKMKYPQQAVIKTPSDIDHLNWQEQGVFSYQDANHSFTASFNWHHENNTSTLQLIGPLGAWRTIIILEPQHVTLITAEGKKFTSPHLEDLMQNNVGWAVPLESIEDWLWGLPAPDCPIKKVVYQNAELVSFKQMEWEIQYPENRKFFSAYYLPTKVFLSGHGKKIILLIQKFQLQPVSL